MFSLQVKPRIFLAYMKAIGPVVSICIVLFYIAGHACSVSANFWLSAWSNDADNATVSMAQRDMRLGVYGGLGLAQGLSTSLWTLFFMWICVKKVRLWCGPPSVRIWLENRTEGDFSSHSRHYSVTLSNCNSHSGPSSGSATWATLNISN